MSIHRGPPNGAQDERHFVRCSHCQKLAKCYRGPLVKVVVDEHGSEWPHWKWACASCMAAIVQEALATT